MNAIFPLAGAVLVLLEALGALKSCERFLPIGGSHVAQLAVILGVAFAAFEVTSILVHGR